MKTREKSRVEVSKEEFPDLEAIERCYKERAEEADAVYRGVSSGYPVVVTGPPASGKSAVVSAVSVALGRREVVADCVRSGSEKQLYGTILSELKLRGISSTSPTASEFVHALASVSEPTVLVVSRAERLRAERFPARTLSLLLRIAELAAPGKIAVVLITEVRWERFVETDPTLPIALIVAFRAYTRIQLLEIVKRSGPGEHHYGSMCGLVFDVVFNACRDLRELKRLCETLYPLYVAPLHDGSIKEGDAAKLYQHLHVHLKHAIQSLYRRSRNPSSASQRPGTAKKSSFSACESFNARVLLLSCYLAAKNPPQMDKRYFTADAQRSRKRRRLARSTASSSSTAPAGGEEGSGALRLLPLERILAIFRVMTTHCGLDDDQLVDGRLRDSVTTPVLVQLATFVSNGHLARSGDSLTEPKFRCMVDERTAERVAKSVNINLHNFLHVPDDQK